MRGMKGECLVSRAKMHLAKRGLGVESAKRELLNDVTEIKSWHSPNLVTLAVYELKPYVLSTWHAN